MIALAFIVGCVVGAWAVNPRAWARKDVVLRMPTITLDPGTTVTITAEEMERERKAGRLFYTAVSHGIMLKSYGPPDDKLLDAITSIPGMRE